MDNVITGYPIGEANSSDLLIEFKKSLCVHLTDSRRREIEGYEREAIALNVDIKE